MALMGVSQSTCVNITSYLYLLILNKVCLILHLSLKESTHCFVDTAGFHYIGELYVSDFVMTTARAHCRLMKNANV